MNTAKTKISTLLIAFALLFLTIGCTQITKENYDKLKMGQDYTEVVEILGKADACSGAVGITKCTWGDDKKHIKVHFTGNKVVLYSAKGL